MKITKIQAIIGLTLASLALAGYAFDAVNYYEPSTHAAEQHASIMSWSELDSIKHQVEVLELKINRITDRAEAARRPLNDGEKQEILSLREEIRIHNDRKNIILKGEK